MASLSDLLGGDLLGDGVGATPPQPVRRAQPWGIFNVTLTVMQRFTTAELGQEAK